MLVSVAAYRSYPAANALPRVGARAVATSFLTSKGGESVSCVVGADAMAEVAVGMSDAPGEGLGRLARGEGAGEGAGCPGAGRVVWQGGVRGREVEEEAIDGG